MELGTIEGTARVPLKTRWRRVNGSPSPVLTDGGYAREDLCAMMDEDVDTGWGTGMERRTEKLYSSSSKMRRVFDNNRCREWRERENGE